MPGKIPPATPLDRRNMLRAAALGSAGMIVTASARDANAEDTRLRPNTPGDQTAALQKAIDNAARAGTPLVIPPGTYRAGKLTLPDGAHLIGVRGATMLVFIGDGDAFLEATRAARITLSGLSLDGRGHPLPRRRGLIHLSAVADVAISECAFSRCGMNAIWLEESGGAVRASRFENIAESAIVARNSSGFRIADNDIASCGDNGIEVLRERIENDGTTISGNRITGMRARAGGSGQHGNAIVLHRVGGVIVSGNHIRDCDYSAIRANSTRNVQITGNTIADAREVAIYSEFSFEGSLILANIIDGAAVGVSVCNFNEGGRLAIVKDNLVRNLRERRPEGSSDGGGGVGIYVEADTIVSGNVIEKAPFAGLFAGRDHYMRDVMLSNNIVRDSGIGVAISADAKAGLVKISDNILSNCPKGAIVGMKYVTRVTGELNAPGAQVPAHIVLSSNHAS